MAKKIEPKQKQSRAAGFNIHVPIGSEKLQLTKSVIKALLQESCNLVISDFSVQEEGGKESVVLDFEPVQK